MFFLQFVIMSDCIRDGNYIRELMWDRGFPMGGLESRYSAGHRSFYRSRVIPQAVTGHPMRD